MASKKSGNENVERAARKVAKFKELAVKRTNKALSAMAGICNLSNRNSYTYDNGQVKRINEALQEAVDAVKAAFDKPETAKKGGFDL